jgi:hypothetical protein
MAIENGVSRDAVTKAVTKTNLRKDELSKHVAIDHGS